MGTVGVGGAIDNVVWVPIDPLCGRMSVLVLVWALALRLGFR